MLPTPSLRQWLSTSSGSSAEGPPPLVLALGTVLLCGFILYLAEVMAPQPEAPDAGPETVAQLQDAGTLDAAPEASDVSFTDLNTDSGEDLGLDRSPPAEPAPTWKRPPCSKEDGEVFINKACWIVLKLKPPCGRNFRWKDECVRPISAAAKPGLSGEQ